MSLERGDQVTTVEESALGQGADRDDSGGTDEEAAEKGPGADERSAAPGGGENGGLPDRDTPGSESLTPRLDSLRVAASQERTGESDRLASAREFTRVFGGGRRAEVVVGHTEGLGAALERSLSAEAPVRDVRSQSEGFSDRFRQRSFGTALMGLGFAELDAGRSAGPGWVELVRDRNDSGR